jgi:ELWxxDGT repeat protein/predicted outer membrane repeat protein
VDYVYQIGKYEVTNAQWREFLTAKGRLGDPYRLYDANMAEAYGGIARSGSGTIGDYSPGDLSLREALALAIGLPGKDVIRFDNQLIGATITLDPTLGQLTVDSYVDIQGFGDPGQLTIRAEGTSRIFRVEQSVVASIDGLTLRGGRARDEAYGGGIYNAGTLTLTRAVVAGNSVQWDGYGTGGGGIYNAGTLTIADATISNNYAQNDGAGIYSNDGTLSLDNVTFAQNTASDDGAAIYVAYGTAILTNVTMCGGSAGNKGGGLYNRSGTVTLANATISGNAAGGGPDRMRGGGVYNRYGKVTLLNSTVYANWAAEQGGGIYNLSGTVALHNTIVAGNSSDAGPAGSDVQGYFATASSHNLIGVIDGATGLDGNGTLCGTVAAALDPRLGPLQDNGGAMLTHGLLPESPALDQGSNDRTIEAELTLDQRGFDRFIDGDGDGTTTVDIGAFEFWGVAGLVWEDFDQDGIQDPEDTGVPRITARVLDQNLALLATTSTDTNGYYAFCDLQPGEYRVEFVAPPGVAFTLQDQGGDDTRDSDADPATGRTARFALSSGLVAHQDAGFRGPAFATVGDWVWEDNDADGIQEASEPGLARVVVTLLDHSNTQVAVTTTAYDGSYGFTGVLPGEYTLQVAPPNHAQFSPRHQGADDGLDSDCDPATGRTNAFTVWAGLPDTSNDAGLFYFASASGTVCNDINWDGLQNAGDSGIPRMTVRLLDNTLALVATTSTDASGNYAFAGLRLGEYSIEFVAPAGVMFSPKDQGSDDTRDSDADPATGRTAPFVLNSRGSADRDAGLHGPLSGSRVSGLVWEDADGDGMREPGDTGFGGTAVKLFDGNLAELASTTTAPDGAYSFSGLAPGWCCVQFVSPAGYTLSLMNRGPDDQFDSDVNRSTGRTAVFYLITGQNGTAQDAGVYSKTTGTALVKDITPGSGSTPFRSLADVNGTLFFATDGGLWKSDSTAAGTVLVKELRDLLYLTSVNGTLFFRADDGRNGSELWRSDGTTSGTVMVKDTWPGGGGGSPEDLTDVNGTLFFDARDATSGRELWKSDGSEVGTVMVKDIRPGNGSSEPERFTICQGTLFFIADDGTNGYELWKSAGTGEGTVLVKDIRPGSEGSSPWELMNLNGTLFFRANDGINGCELWKSAGTANGTVLVKDIWPGSNGSETWGLTNVNGTLFFTANDGANGYELWKSDGTAAGTIMLRDICPGANGSGVYKLTNANGTLFFTANDGIHGYELWKSDGRGFSPDVRSSLRITEIKTGDPEFIELKNIGPNPLDLTEARFIDGIDFDFRLANLRSLFPGECLVLVQDPADFARHYDASEINIAGQYGGALPFEGERLEMVAPINHTILAFTYDPYWFVLTGYRQDFTLTVRDETADPAAWNDRSNWRPGSRQYGSPGFDDPRLTPDPGAVVINELMTRESEGDRDWIELKNTTAANIDIGGWYLGDEKEGRPDFTTYRIPAGTVIPAGGYLVFYREQFDFGLSSDGEYLQLTAGDAAGNLLGYSEQAVYGAADADVTFGPYGDDFVALSQPTPGGENAPPKVGPVVINEIMYHPAYLHDEFIELYNAGLDPVNGGGWTLEGVGYQLAQGTVIPGKGFLLVVPIDPQQFRAKYQIPDAIPIVGPYPGSLDNAGEDLLLYKTDAEGRQIRVDRVHYDDELPWPEEADQGGGSLERVAPGAYGNDPTNWAVTTVFGGTPGRQNSVTVSAVVGRRVFYNNSAFDGANPAANSQDDAAIATDKQALLPSNQASFVNYTSYSRGINGIMVDIAGLANPAGLNATDFQFKVGNDDHPESTGWTTAANPSVTTQDLGGGVTRVTLIWPENDAVKNQWLQVTVLATANTGLAAPDVFYFGNAIGETGNNSANAIVDLADGLAARSHKSGFTPALITNPYDFNRDRRVNATDELIARYNHSGTPLQLIDLSGAGQGFAPAVVVSAPATSVPMFNIGIALPTSVGIAVSSDSAFGLTSQQALPKSPGPTPKPAAHDAVLTASLTSRGMEAWSSAWAWLAEFEQVRTKKPSSKKDLGNAEAVDNVLAAYSS